MKKKRISIDILMLTIIILPALCSLYYVMHLEREQRIERYSGYTQEQLIDNITIRGNDNSVQQVRLFNNGDGYSAFLPAEMETDARIYFSAFEYLEIAGNGTYRSGNNLSDLTDDFVYDVQFIGWNHQNISNTRITFYHADSIPTMYISTEGGTTEEIDASKDIRIDAFLMTVNTDGSRDAADMCTIRTRGNSSFTASQKSYNINIDHTTSIFGMDAASEWALLANYSDSTQQLRNKMTYDLATRIGLEYTPDCCFINLYIDGEYRGLYLLTERPTVDGGSVHIDDLESEHEDDIGEVPDVKAGDTDGVFYSYRRTATSANNITGGYLFEENSRYVNEDNYFAVATLIPVVIKNPASLSDEEFIYISSYVQEAIDTLANGNSTIGDLQQYFDIDSWVRIYILQDFAVEWDVEFDSFKFYKKRDDPLLYGGPVWDFDLAYGYTFASYFPQLTQRTMFLQDDRAYWLSTFDNHEEFITQVRQLYVDEYLPLVDEYITSDLLRIAEENRSSIAMAARRWNKSSEDYDNEVYQLYQWTAGRAQFLREYLADPNSYRRVTFQLAFCSFSYYVKDGEPLNYLPTAHYGENDYGAFGYPEKWITDDGTELDVKQPVTKDMVVTAVYEEVESYSMNMNSSSLASGEFSGIE